MSLTHLSKCEPHLRVNLHYSCLNVKELLEMVSVVLKRNISNTAILSCDTGKPQLRTSARAKIENKKICKHAPNLFLLLLFFTAKYVILISTANITWVVFNKSAHRVGWNIWHFSCF